MKKRIFDQLSWLNQPGPFITIVVPSTFKVNEFAKDRLHFKNLMKEAHDEFHQKYPEHNYEPYERFLNDFYHNRELWVGGAHSLIFIVNEKHADVMRLSLDVQPTSYVDDAPHILPFIEDMQRLSHFYILALNRDAFKLFEVSDRDIVEVDLPDDAPTTLDKALGDDTNPTGFQYGSGRVGQGDSSGFYGGVSGTRDARAVDRKNYFYAVDRFLNEYEALDNLQIELFSLPENRSEFLEVSKLINLDRDMGVLSSPEDFNIKHILNETLKATEAKNKRNLESLYDDLDRYRAAQRVSQDLVLIKEKAQYGAIGTLYISKERLDNKDYLANEIAMSVLDTGGLVYILKSNLRLGAEKMTALLRYKV